MSIMQCLSSSDNVISELVPCLLLAFRIHASKVYQSVVIVVDFYDSSGSQSVAEGNDLGMLVLICFLFRFSLHL